MITERVRFYTNRKAMTLEDKPEIMDVLKEIAILMNAEKKPFDSISKSEAYFVNTESEKLSNYFLQLIKSVSEKLHSSACNQVEIRYKSKKITCVGDSTKTLAFIAFVKALAETDCDKIALPSSDEKTFEAVNEAAKRLGIFPA